MPSINRFAKRLRVRDLHMIETIADRGSMARAAEYLGLSQPAVSKAVADLELDLGVTIFERNTRGVHLTESGEILRKRGRIMLDELQHGLDEIQNIADPTRGLVRVGVTPGQSFLITSVIERVSRRYPGIRFNVVMSDPLVLIRVLHERELDLVICRGQMTKDDPALQADILFRDRIEVVVAPSHPFAKRRSMSLAELTGERWALPAPETYLGGLVRNAFRAQGLSMPSAVVTTASLQLRFELMEFAGFVTLAARSMVTNPSRRGRIKALSVAFNDEAGPMAIITVRHRQLTNVCSLVLDQVRSAAKSIAASE